VIKGYKFNVFYPDVTEKAKTPQNFVEPATQEEPIILRYHLWGSLP
jgi:hypothetical protein